jgi:hypothetical protein
LAGTTGLEPATSDVTGRRSNQLNYVPAILAPREFAAHAKSAISSITHAPVLLPYAISVLISWEWMLFLPPRPRMSAPLNLPKSRLE